MFVSAEEFVEIWQKAKSLSEVCSKTGLATASASVKASNLRAAGVPLKVFAVGSRVGPKTVDVNGLKSLAKKYARA